MAFFNNSPPRQHRTSKREVLLQKEPKLSKFWFIIQIQPRTCKSAGDPLECIKDLVAALGRHQERIHRIFSGEGVVYVHSYSGHVLQVVYKAIKVIISMSTPSTEPLTLVANQSNVRQGLSAERSDHYAIPVFEIGKALVIRNVIAQKNSLIFQNKSHL